MQAWVAAIGWSACFATGCFSTAKYDRAHEQRMTEINRRYDAERQQIEQRGRARAAEIDGRKKSMIEIKPESAYSPVTRIDQNAWYTELDTLCMQLKARADAADADRAAVVRADQCWHKLYTETYLPALKARYAQADAAQTVQLWLNAKGTNDLEALFAYAHNTAILDEIRWQIRQVDAEIEHEIVDLEQKRRAEIVASSAPRDLEATVVHVPHRTALAAVGEPAAQPAQLHADLRSLSVKLPVSTDCKLTIDCPIGFTCDAQTGSCLR